MLFTLLHNLYSTTVLTIWRETRSARWTAVATLLTLALGFTVCLTTAILAHVLMRDSLSLKMPLISRMPSH